MFSFIYITRIYRSKIGQVLFYAVTMITLWLSIQMRYFRSSETEDEAADNRRVADWQRIWSRESCYMSRDEDALELLDNNISLPASSIFFHETTCKGDLTSRQVCVVESAAKAHPNNQITVFFTSAVSEKTLKHGYVSTLKHYGNVKLVRVLIKDYANGTPLASKVEHMSIDDLKIHVSKIMKFLTLYKYGGIYLSLDMIVARRLDLWENWAVKESPRTLSSDMFAFSKNTAGSSLAREALSVLLPELEEQHKRDFWSYSGPSMIFYLLAFWCSTNNVEKMTRKRCKDLEVHDHELFYPVSFHDRQKYFRTADWEDWKKKLIYTYFVWNRFTQYHIVTPRSLFGKIADEYCPVTYHRYRDASGVWYPE